MTDLKYVCDKARHLICVLYSIENLHRMAEDLNIKRCHFHKNHYDIPKKRVEDISSKCIKVGFYTIKEIINSPAHAEAFLSDPISHTPLRTSNQVLPEYEVMKYNGFTD